MFHLTENWMFGVGHNTYMGEGIMEIDELFC